MSSKAFNIDAFNLESKQLFLEASAGTGKTYALEHLVLRTIVEQHQKLSRIVLITFTKKATAELRIRVAGRIRQLLTRLEELTDLDSTQAAIIEKDFHCKLPEPGNYEKLKTHLKSELQNIDEACIETIHAFCLRMLRQRPDIAGLSPEFKVIADEAVKRRLRVRLRELCRDKCSREITIQSEKILGEIGANLLSFPFAYEFLPDPDQILKEAELPALPAGLNEEFIEQCKNEEIFNKNRLPKFQRRLAVMKAMERGDISALEKAPAQIKDDFKSYTDPENKFPSTKKWPKDQEPYLSIKTFFDPGGGASEYTDAFFDLLPALTYKQAVNILCTLRDDLTHNLIEENYLRQDDYIKRLHEQREKFQKPFQEQTDLLIVDEFQDTDEKQWEIFESLCKNHVKLWVVGDPKQAIYGFRGGDLETYFRAKNSFKPSALSELQTNYRTGEALGHGLNQLFSQNWFLGSTSTPLAALATLDFREVTYANAFSSRLKTILVEKPADFIKTTVRQISLDPELKLGTIAILAKTNYELQGAAAKLKEFGIPYSFDVKSSSERELTETMVLIDAILNPAEHGLQLLLTRFFPFTPEMTQEMYEAQFEISSHQLITQLRLLAANKNWPTFFQYLRDHSALGQRLAQEGDPIGTLLIFENIWTKLCIAAQQKSMSLADLREHIERDSHQLLSLDEDDLTEDSQQPREERLVQLMTIHKSKGLEFDHVFVFPHRKKSRNNNRRPWQLAHQETNSTKRLVYGSTQDKIFSEQYNVESEAETQRLFYVAYTRAKKSLFIGYTDERDTQNQSLQVLSVAEQYALPSEDETLSREDYAQDNKILRAHSNLMLSSGSFTGRGRRFESYTSLDKKTTAVIEKGYKDDNDDSEELEIEIDDVQSYSELPRGAAFGTIFHECLEKENWQTLTQENPGSRIEPYLKKIPKYRNADQAGQQAMMEQFEMLVKNSLNAVIPLHDRHTIALGSQKEPKDAREVDFLLRLAGMNSEKEEFLQGSIDLVFYAAGKYFVLDWKTNLLSASELQNIDKYTDEKYGLQKRIYLLALYQWLEARGINPGLAGGTVYLYARHAKAGTSSGVNVDLIDKSTFQASDIEKDLHKLFSTTGATFE